MEIDTFLRDKRSWNRKLLNVYWGIIAANIPMEFIHLFNQSSMNVQFIKSRILVPTLIIISIMLVLEWIKFMEAPLLDYAIISGGCLLSFCFIYVNYDVKVVLITLFLPVLISIFYFERPKIFFSIFITLTAFFILYPIRLAPMGDYSTKDFIVMIPILCFVSYIALQIMNRGVDLMHNLKITTESRQELMIQNIIMDKLSKTDALTDMYNHITFHEYLEKLIEQSEAGHLTIQLAILDIDNFKKINDIYGHRAGDAILKRVSGILKQWIGPNDFAARYGGEEFAFIFADKSLEEVFDLLENIRWQISQTVHEELHGQAVTISIGLHEYRKGSSKEELFAWADKSLYEAKRTGKNKTIIFEKKIAAT